MTKYVITPKIANLIANKMLILAFSDNEIVRKKRALARPKISTGISGIGLTLNGLEASVKDFIVGDGAEICKTCCDMVDRDYVKFAKLCGYEISEYPELEWLTH